MEELCRRNAPWIGNKDGNFRTFAKGYFAQFCADCTDRDIEDVGPLVDLLYKKTLAFIFFVRQAMEELCRRNILYYDMICYEWQWNLDACMWAEFDDYQ